MWVPLVENNEYESSGADYFVEKNVKNLLAKGGHIDTVLLACTHYPLLKDKIKKYLPGGVNLLSQGEIVATSLVDYFKRHPEMESRCSKQGVVQFYTTDSIGDFDAHAAKTGRLGLCALVSLWHISSRTLSRIKNAICIEDNQPKKKSGISF